MFIGNLEFSKTTHELKEITVLYRSDITKLSHF